MSDEDDPKAASDFGSWRIPMRQLDDFKWEKTTPSSWKNFCKVTPMEEKSAALQDELDSVTTCYICDETYRNPMILPCIHTFCLTCLQRIGNHTDKTPCDQMLCPLCKEKFTIPEDGFAALRKNVFMVRLIEMTTTQEECACACDLHEKEKLCMFCFDCDEVICLVCLRESHVKHRMADLTSAAEIIRSQLQCNVDSAKQCMSDALKKKERLLEKKVAVLEEIQDIEAEVNQVRRDLKALIDRHADSLLQDLTLLRMERIEDIEIEEQKITTHLDFLKNFEIYCAELTSNDRHNGLFCEMATDLNKQIGELELLNETIVGRQLCSFDIQFTRTEPTSLGIYRTKNIIGVVRAKNDQSRSPELLKIIACNNASSEHDDTNNVSGIAVSNNDVFVVYENSPVVSVFDSRTRSRVTQMTLKGFVREVDLKHCVSVDGNVYIVNGRTREIVRIDQNRDFIKWSTGNALSRLSVSDESTIVAACYESRALVEYSQQGTLLNEIKLCPTMIHPMHAIKLGNGHFVVSHGCSKDAVNRVCMVNDVGAITKKFGDQKGFSIHQINGPICLAVDDNGNVLVLDRNNSRVLLLGPDLEFRRVLLTRNNGLRRSVAMHLDKKTAQLYIANNNWEQFKLAESRVLVFHIK